MKHNNTEKGQALVIIALAAVVLIGFAALAIDGSMVFSDRRHAQNAADTSAMAAALARTRGQSYIAAAQARAESNGYDGNNVSNIVDVTGEDTPKGACPDTGKDITVKITSYVKLTFARILGWTQLTNVVSATARSCDLAGGKPLYTGSAVYSTKPSSCSGSNDSSLYMNGSGNLHVYGGDLGSGSTDPRCLNFQGGVTLLGLNGTDCANIVTSALNGGTFNNVTDTCGDEVIYGQSFANPPADLGITCIGNATTSGNTMSPGNFSGSFPPNNVDTLNPGTYCVNGDFQLNANQVLTGICVTIVMNTGTLKWNGSSEPNLSAPTSGDLKGLLIYAPPSNSYASGNNEINIDGSGNAHISGTVLAQNLPCYFAGSGQINQAKLQFICYTWGMSGNGTGEIIYDSSVLFSPIIQPSMTLLR